MSRYFDVEGNPMSTTEWVKKFSNMEYKKIGFDELVSTVWLGLDHQFGDGPPLIFETMVFGGPMDQNQERYSTKEQAIKGHAEMVAKCKVALMQAKAEGKANG